MGRPGRRITKELLKKFIYERKIDFVVANGENLSGGKGLTLDSANEMFQCGIDVITGGNHIWANKEIFNIIDINSRILRPANYPEGVDVPGRGSGIYTAKNGVKIGVLNLIGRIFLGNFDCPFRIAIKEVAKIKEETSLIIVDFHAEATSEKVAMGWYLAEKVTAVIGTHTHIQTADEVILNNYTAYITDVGMTGPYDSVIGVRKDIILKTFLQQIPTRHELGSGDLRFCGAIIDADPDSGRASSIERVRIDLDKDM